MSAYKLKISIVGSDPLITRTVAVPDHASFADLNSIIQSVMGWNDYHLHEYSVDDRLIGPPEVDCRSPDGSMN